MTNEARSGQSRARIGAGEPASYDIVVVGAGFAGLVAAREASHRGCNVLLIEARNRIGGRTHSEKHGDVVIELGGTWINSSQPNVWTEVQRYGLELVDRVPYTRFILSKGGVPKDVAAQDIAAALGAGLAKLFDESLQVFPQPYQPFVAANEVLARSRISIADRMMQIQLTGLEKDLVGAFYNTLGHCDLNEISYADALRVWSLGGRSLPTLADSLNRFKFRHGTGALAAAIQADTRSDLLFSEPVVAINQDSSGVDVTTSAGRKVRAKAVIVTVPINVLASVEFYPPLNQQKMKHSTERHAGHGLKGFAFLKQNVGRLQGFAPDAALISSIRTDEAGPDGSRMIIFGPSQERLDVSDLPAVERAIHAFLPGVELTKVLGHDWVSDPFSRGTWSSYRPGQIEYFPQNQVQEGRIFFASGDTATAWRGYIEGAIERGLRTGLEASQLIQRERNNG
jgi:pseudooxynicotine oxidase